MTHRAMVIGEAPGSHEDRLGKPFVGKAGQLLDRALTEAFGDSTGVIVTNVVKCRPPGNRDPLPAEIDACFPYLSEEVTTVDPIAILCLGNVAASVLLGQTGISALRGTWKTLNRTPPIPVMPTYHPAFVSYQGGFGSTAWEIFTDDVSVFANYVRENK